MITKVVRARLVADPMIAALGLGFRVHPMGEGQGTPLPRITYLLVSQVRKYAQTGSSNLVTSRIQLNLHAQDEGTAAALANAVRGCLEGFHGSWGQTRIDSVFLDHVHGDYQSDPSVHQRIMDFLITHTEVTS
jgi:hypothetical protein